MMLELEYSSINLCLQSLYFLKLSLDFLGFSLNELGLVKFLKRLNLLEVI